MSVIHSVYFSFKESTDAAERAGVYADLCAMKDKVDGLEEVIFGNNTSFEGMERGYHEGFVMKFKDRAAHLVYHEHEAHKAAGARLVAACENGIDGIFVFDFEA